MNDSGLRAVGRECSIHVPQKPSGSATHTFNMFRPRKVIREPNTEVFKVMHSFNKLTIEVKGWTIPIKCTAAGDEHKLSFGRVKIQMTGVYPLLKVLLIIIPKHSLIESRQCNGK